MGGLFLFPKMLQQALQFAGHWLKAQTRYGVHSPFVYEFVTQVLPHKPSAVGKRIEALRKQLAQSTDSVEIRDFGAGYGGEQRPLVQKKVRDVIRSSARKRRNGELLHRICAHYQPGSCLELGTNLGFSTLYQASACPRGHFTSLEGAPALAEIAGRHFDEFGLEIDLRVGEFGDSLEKLLSEGLRFDYVLLDGNHRREATVDYFELLEQRMNPGGILIVDDINWSEGMREAWKIIQQKESVSVSIDLFWMGICILHRPQAKEAFRFRFRS